MIDIDEELAKDEAEEGSQGEDETGEPAAPASERRIFTDQKDPEVSALLERKQRGRLHVQSDFQRQFVWDATKSSRLIESCLLDIPLPVIYLIEENDGSETVIDGQQRLTAFFSFIEGRFPDGKEFKLSKLQEYPELNGRRFEELDQQLQDKIRNCSLRTITFRKESGPDELRFQVFERLNTGAVQLNHQELRNCVYRGRYNDLLKELSEEPDFRYLLGLHGPERRMRDVALVLRFAAFFHRGYQHYAPPMERFLDRDIRDYREISDEGARELRVAFKNSLSILRSLFDDRAFRTFHPGSPGRPNGYWQYQGYNSAIYDVLMFSFATEDRNRVIRNADALREAWVDLLSTDLDFRESISTWTNRLDAVTTRFGRAWHVIRALLDEDRRETRFFTREFKRGLFEANPECGICGQAILVIDDAAVDTSNNIGTADGRS